MIFLSLLREPMRPAMQLEGRSFSFNLSSQIIGHYPGLQELIVASQDVEVRTKDSRILGRNVSALIPF